ncbi:MAG: cardiolipin synthase [Sphaerochaetaceae bacterium]|jgi:cardiolipin synthase
MKKFLKLLTGRLFVFIALILIQVGVLVWLIRNFMNATTYYLPISSLLATISLFYIVNSDENPIFKIAWMLVIMVAPIFGLPFYILFGNKRVGKRVALQMAKYQEHYEREIRSVLPTPSNEVFQQLKEYSPNLARQANYIANLAGAPLWDNTEVEYYPLGELAFEAILEEVKKAKKFILFEYFIVEEGEMWSSMLSLLKEKVDQGVVVRIMYDDLGSIRTLPPGYENELRQMGFLVGVFNKIKPHLNAKLNYRDHRKILIVDGDVGFTGGINFADEYINKKIRFGHWKDSTVMLKGDAVWNLTLMFFQQWVFTTNEDISLAQYVPKKSYPSDGFVQPFGDSPLDGENISEHAYIQIINHAQKYVWITTPYLIIDTQMMTALNIAAQSGVDVRIVTPYFHDKWYVHPVTRANYHSLLKSGVRIYEYTPGFMHAKMFVSDDEVAIVGTTNMDFRSFYLHFECGVAFFNSSISKKVRNDIADTIELSKEITLLEEESLTLPVRFARSVLKLFSPIM